METETTNTHARDVLALAAGGIVFALFAISGSFTAGIVAGFFVYAVVDSYLGDEDGESDDAYDASAEGADDAGGTDLPSRTAVEGPSGEVLATGGEADGFDERYAVHVTSLRPVTVELEPADETSPAAVVRPVAERLGYGDSALVDRIAPELPDRVEDEIIWRITNDLDRRLQTDIVEDTGASVLGYCDIRAADEFDGFTYTVEYLPGYVED